VSDDRFIATDRGLDQRSLAVLGSSLPFHPPIGVDRRDITVSLTGEIGVWPFRRIGAWRNDHRSTRAMLGDGANGVVDLVEQRLHLRGVAGILVSYDLCDDLATGGGLWLTLSKRFCCDL